MIIETHAEKMEKRMKTSVSLVTGSSGYVLLRAPNGLMHILLVIRLEHKFGRSHLLQLPKAGKVQMYTLVCFHNLPVHSYNPK